MADGLTYFGWADHTKKKSSRAKLADAVEAFVDRFGRAPNVCLTSGQDAAELAGVEGIDVQARSYIQKNIYYVACEEAA